VAAHSCPLHHVAQNLVPHPSHRVRNIYRLPFGGLDVFRLTVRIYSFPSHGVTPNLRPLVYSVAQTYVLLLTTSRPKFFLASSAHHVHTLTSLYRVALKFCVYIYIYIYTCCVCAAVSASPSYLPDPSFPPLRGSSSPRRVRTSVSSITPHSKLFPLLHSCHAESYCLLFSSSHCHPLWCPLHHTCPNFYLGFIMSRPTYYSPLHYIRPKLSSLLPHVAHVLSLRYVTPRKLFVLPSPIALELLLSFVAPRPLCSLFAVSCSQTGVSSSSVALEL
jgi:hypothetical protein